MMYPVKLFRHHYSQLRRLFFREDSSYTHGSVSNSHCVCARLPVLPQTAVSRERVRCIAIRHATRDAAPAPAAHHFPPPADIYCTPNQKIYWPRAHCTFFLPCLPMTAPSIPIERAVCDNSTAGRAVTPPRLAAADSVAFFAEYNPPARVERRHAVCVR